MQWLIADNWPGRLWMGLIPLAVPAAVCWYVGPWTWFHSHWFNSVFFACLLVLAWVLGQFTAMIPGWLILGPLYYSQGLDNGAPYAVGDYVRVLTRRQRGRVARVYEIWAERSEVRLELGEHARQRVEDVFSHFEICRELHPPNHAPSGDGGEAEIGTGLKEIDSIPS